MLYKEITLERADFTLQLLMFATAGKEGQMFIIFFLSSFCQLLSVSAVLSKDERVHTKKVLTKQPRSQLFLM